MRIPPTKSQNLAHAISRSYAAQTPSAAAKAKAKTDRSSRVRWKGNRPAATRTAHGNRPMSKGAARASGIAYQRLVAIHAQAKSPSANQRLSIACAMTFGEFSEGRTTKASLALDKKDALSAIMRIWLEAMDHRCGMNQLASDDR